MTSKTNPKPRKSTRPKTTEAPLPPQPFGWWRTKRAELFDAPMAVAMREALATIVILGEPNWRAAAAGDASAAVGLALRLNPERSTATAYELIMTALAACAVDGDAGARLAMSFVIRRMPNAGKPEARIATSWMVRGFSNAMRKHALGEPS